MKNGETQPCPALPEKVVFLRTGEVYEVVGFRKHPDPSELDFTVLLKHGPTEIGIRACQFFDGRYGALVLA